MSKKYTIALAGNPNVGKSTIFNSLTGMHQHTGNWPGKTVANATGEAKINNKEFIFVDIPGTYSLMAHSEEEEIARDYICNGNADVTVVVVDSTCLERNLNLAFQIMELTPNVILCVNLLDEAKKKKIKIDLEKLSKILGVPVVGTTAKKKKTLENLKETIYKVATGKIKCIPKMIEYEEKEHESNKNQEEINKAKNAEEKVTKILNKAEEICKQVCTFENKNYSERDRKIDKILTSKKYGIPIMILFLAIIFWITIIGANYPSEILFTFFGWIQKKLIYMATYINCPQWLSDMLILGVYQTLTWVISVMLPPMAIFFPLFTFLEDLGYLPRIAFNMDKFFKKACCTGKQMITMCMGFGCNAAGILGCRIIDSPRERLIAMITNSFVPCNGRFPILISIITMFFVGSQFQSFTATLLLTGMIVLGIAMTFWVSRLLSKTILKGIPSSFTLELPPYRRPQIGKVIVRSLLDRTIFVLGRAVAVAAPAGAILWIMANVTVGDATLLAHCSNFLDPFGHLLGMDGTILLAFILGWPANEIVVPIIIMAYMCSNSIMEFESLLELKTLLVDHGWTWLTAICTMLFCLMHWPCSTTCFTIKKESKSWKWTIISFLTPTLIGMACCFVVANISRIFVPGI